MRFARRLSLGWIGVAALTLGMLLSGCGATSTTRLGQAAATNAPTTPTPWPTPAASATPAPISTASSAGVPETVGCPPDNSPTPPNHVAVGALSVFAPRRVLDYPDTMMPNNIPQGPYQIAADAVTNYHPTPPVNPSLTPGYTTQVCNQTTKAHTLTGVAVTIANFTPSSGPVNVWHFCKDGPYDTATKQIGGGCGGGVGFDTMLEATLPNDLTGASASATVRPQQGAASLPYVIDPNNSITLAVAVNGLSSQGTYALTFGVSVDGAAPTTVAPSDGAFVIAPSAVVWTGTACQTPAMQAQIPSSSQATYYVCPPAS